VNLNADSWEFSLPAKCFLFIFVCFFHGSCEAKGELENSIRCNEANLVALFLLTGSVRNVSKFKQYS
jgi:hypothetical protein